MISKLSYQSRRELVRQMAPRYQEASRARKSVLLDEFVALTGYVRKYAIQLLNHPEEPKPRSRQVRLPHYGPEVQQALLLAWKAANQICTKRLIPFLPTLVEAAAAAWTSASHRGVPQTTALNERHDGRSHPALLSATGDTRGIHYTGGNPAQTSDSHTHLPGLE